MVEVKPHPHSGNSGILQGILTIGVFGTAFYFLFLRGNKAFGQTTTDNRSNVGQPFNESEFIKQHPHYMGRQEFKSSDGNPKNTIKGFPMPDRYTDLQYVNYHIDVVTKPDADGLFGGLPARAGVKLYSRGSKLGYEGRVNGVQGQYYENYDDIKDKIVLTKNIFIKNYKLPS
jgi:hypothetical protein